MSAQYLEPMGPLRPAPAAVALITDEAGRYLVQLRDDKPTIFFPNHWGCFGGALEPGESFEQALRRELIEELEFDIGAETPPVFTEFTFDFGFAGGGVIQRRFYTLSVKAADAENFTLSEGASFGLVEGQDLLQRQVVPYDRFAIWMHLYRDTLKQAGV